MRFGTVALLLMAAILLCGFTNGAPAGKGMRPFVAVFWCGTPACLDDKK